MKPTRALIIGLFVCSLSAIVVHADDKPTMPLCDAAAAGNIDEVKAHIAAGTDLNAKDAVGRTPLSAAVVAGQLETVTLLTEAGADPTLDTRQGAPILTAIQRGKLDIVRVFVEKGGIDVNASLQGASLINAARRHPDIVAYLKSKGAVEPQALGDSPYGTPEMGGPTGRQIRRRQPGNPFGTEPDVLADANAIRAKVHAVSGLEAKLKVLDANATGEMRSWRQRNVDNRLSLLRSVRKQFEDEMALVKDIALKETGVQPGGLGHQFKALLNAAKGQPQSAEPNSAAAPGPKLISAIDELVTRRAKRYDLISDELRQQRREMLRQNRETNTGMRGRGRGLRGRGMVEPGPAYQTPSPRTMRRPGQPAPESKQPALDPDTESQLNAWLSANPEDKTELLKAVHDMDKTEYGVLHQAAVAAKAPNTAAAVAGLMLAHQNRLQAVEEKMAADDERLQRLSERNGGLGQEQTTLRRGRRSR